MANFIQNGPDLEIYNILSGMDRHYSNLTVFLPSDLAINKIPLRVRDQLKADPAKLKKVSIF